MPAVQTAKRLSELTNQRDRLFTLIQIRKALGFSAASDEALLMGLEATLACINYQIALAEDHKKK